MSMNRDIELDLGVLVRFVEDVDGRTDRNLSTRARLSNQGRLDAFEPFSATKCQKELKPLKSDVIVVLFCQFCHFLSEFRTICSYSSRNFDAVSSGKSLNDRTIRFSMSLNLSLVYSSTC